MGEDGAGEKIEVTSQDVFQRAAHQRAAVGLEMRIGQGDVVPCAEKSGGMDTGRHYDFFRRVGAEITENFFFIFLQTPQVLSGIFGNFVQVVKFLHRDS